MRFFSRTRKPTELDRARESLIVLVAGFAGRVEESARASAALRAEVSAMRVELAALPGKVDASATRAALELVRDAGRQVGIAQQQAAALADSDAMLELATDLAERGLLAEMSAAEGAPDG